MARTRGSWSGIALLLLLLPSAAVALEPTLWFTDPEQLVAAGVPVNLGNHAATRFVDWDDDGLLDVLVGGGDGYVYIIVNVGTANEPSFAAPQHVQSAGGFVRAGYGYTGACFVDVTGDGLKDLLVAEGTLTPDQVRLYRNVGAPGAPSFGYYEWLMGPSQPVRLPGDANGRLDVGDYDADGLADLVSGEFDGYVSFLRNVGSETEPRFAAGVHIRAGGGEIHLPYNTHPRIFDVNQDGTADLGCGYNWGHVFMWVAEEKEPAQPPRLSTIYFAYDARGERLNLRPLNGDDSTPDFGDLDGDGFLDIVSGGINGKLFLMFGIPPATRLARIDEIMQQYPSTLPDVLRDDAAVRQELFGLHHSMRTFIGELLRDAAHARPYADWYHDHVLAYPWYFTKEHLDPVPYSYIPWLAGQVQINLLESQPDTPEHRAWVADTIELTGRQRDITTGFGTLFVENDMADDLQEDVLYTYLSVLPREVWAASFISIADYLGGDRPSEVHLEARAGVNIFGLRVGDMQENVFPSDIAPRYADVFLICLAHEINHTVDRYIERGEWLSWRRADLLLRAGYDDMQYLRSQVGGAFFQQHPQEFVASLANEWFSSGRHTFDLARSRFDRGWHEPMNQFLFMVEVYATEWNRTNLYSSNTGGEIAHDREIVLREGSGSRINVVYIGSDQVRFTLDDGGNVLAYEILPADRDMDGRPDAEDCAPDDPDSWAPPGEIEDVRFWPADKRTLHWLDIEPQVGWGILYDVLRGFADELPVGSGAGEECQHTPNDYFYDEQVPPAGRGFWYIVRGRNSCGTGTFGRDSSGGERISSACP